MAYEKDKKPTCEHSGHRQRLLSKLEDGTLCDHEYLEAVLFWALPRRNTNDLAHRLFSVFGSLQGIFSASLPQLCSVDGVGKSVAQFIYAIGKLLKSASKSTELIYPQTFEHNQFAAFIRAEYSAFSCEVVDIYMLDSTGRIQGRRRQTSLREKKVEMHIRWLMDILRDFSPSGIVIVHNHPKGEAKPSKADDKTTEECRSLCEKNGIVLCDHFIYAREGIYSYRLGGRCDEGKTMERWTGVECE